MQLLLLLHQAAGCAMCALPFACITPHHTTRPACIFSTGPEVPMLTSHFQFCWAGVGADWRRAVDGRCLESLTGAVVVASWQRLPLFQVHPLRPFSHGFMLNPVGSTNASTAADTRGHQDVWLGAWGLLTASNSAVPLADPFADCQQRCRSCAQCTCLRLQFFATLRVPGTVRPRSPAHTFLTCCMAHSRACSFAWGFSSECGQPAVCGVCWWCAVA